MDTMDTVDFKKLMLMESKTYKQNGAPRYNFFGKSFRGYRGF
jgi:hypothetical protein